MKTLYTLFLLVVVFAVFPRLAAADEDKGERGDRVRERIAASLADLSLTDEQDAKIAEIRKEFRPTIQEAAKELAAVLKAELDKVRAVLTPEQREKRSAQKERRLEGLAERIAHLKDLDLTEAELAQIEEFREQYRPQIENLMKNLAGVLTEEQREARMEALKSGESRREVRESLNLTEEQREKVESIGKELLGVERQKLEKIKSVLTPEQQQKLAAQKEERREHARDRLAAAIDNDNSLKLTADEKSKIAEIRKEYRPKVQQAGDKLRAAVRDEVAQILTVIKG